MDKTTFNAPAQGDIRGFEALGSLFGCRNMRNIHSGCHAWSFFTAFPWLAAKAEIGTIIYLTS